MHLALFLVTMTMFAGAFRRERDAAMGEANKKHSGSLLLTGWTPLTTRLLREGRIGHAWNYWDDPDESRAGRLLTELRESGLLSKLVPARTTTDATVAQLARLLSLTTVEEDEPAAVPNTTRGDCSLFVDRSYRSTDSFSRKLPCLAQLIAAIEHTAVSNLADHNIIELDLSMTSVQIAEYPGDGRSSYPRHCDCQGNVCSPEPNDDASADPNHGDRSNSNNNNDTTSQPLQRILTVIYYLTDPDWSTEKDGGCLRIFHNDNNNVDSQSYTDVAPYAGRTVIFRSDRVEHAVQACRRRPRRAVTIWLYGRVQKNGLAAASSSLGVATSIQSIAEKADEANVTTTFNLPPPLPYNPQTDEKNATIFVSIAAYRDSETGPTIRHMMATALHPERIFVGLVLQIDTRTNTANDSEFDDQRDVVDQLPTEEPWWYERVRVLQMDARHASGPCPARALCQQLYRGETYMLQIDAHMRFRPNWDAYCIDQLLQCPHPERSILTAYPVGYTLPNNIPNETRGTLLLPWKFDKDNMLRIRGRIFSPLDAQRQDAPVPCHLWAAGFNFCTATRVLRDCPYNGSLHHLFFGEEISMAVRLFTCGYELFAPPQTVVYHLWSRAHRPPALSLPNNDKERAFVQRQEALEKVRGQVRDGRGEGLGSVRDASAFGSVMGVDFNSAQVLVGDCEHAATLDVALANSIGIDVVVDTFDAPNTKSLIKAFLG